MELDRYIFSECSKCEHMTEHHFNSQKDKFANYFTDKNHIKCESCGFLEPVEGWIKEIMAVATRKDKTKAPR